MNRRQCIALLGGAAAWPLAARAQQSERKRRIGVPPTASMLEQTRAIPVVFASAQQDGKAIRIGYLGANLNSPSTAAAYQAFLSELRVLGFSEGENILIEYRRVDDPRGIFIAAAELVRSQPRLIVARGPEVAPSATRRRGDRISTDFAALHSVAIGTKRM